MLGRRARGEVEAGPARGRWSGSPSRSGRAADQRFSEDGWERPGRRLRKRPGVVPVKLGQRSAMCDSQPWMRAVRVCAYVLVYALQ
ncbi:hypothetical protein [Streptomyces sp. P9-A2]|uniref:hypothetical protein n=1 Tax=Streptomyces sp. P9-A2 TaxID=3072284 RepID=UPI002FC622DC